MQIAVSALVLSTVLAYGLNGRDVTLTLAHPLKAGEALSLELTIGAIPRGSEIEITTPSGRTLGTISPYGARSGREGGTYTVPLPADVVSNKNVSVRLSITEYGRAQRAPTSDEVKSVRLKTATVPR